MIVGIVGSVWRDTGNGETEFAGQARAGKDTAAEVLMGFGFAKRGFGDPIREFVARAHGVSFHNIDAFKGETIHGGNVILRRAMETLGTEWGRNLIGSEFWIRWAQRDWAAIERTGADVVVPDVRFQNEIDAVREAGGTILEVRRLVGFHWAGRGVGGADPSHPSNQRIDPGASGPVEILLNDRGVAELQEQVRRFAKGLVSTVPVSTDEE